MALIIKFYKERREKTINMTPSRSQGHKKKKKLNRKLQSKHLQAVLLLREKGEANAHVGHYHAA